LELIDAMMDAMSETTLPPNVSIAVSDDAYTLAAQTIVDLAQQAVKANGKFTIALSGGSTPKKLYELLTSPAWQSKMPWAQTEFFWGDERYVPSTDDSSNYRMTQQAMLSRVTVPAEHVHRVPTEKEAQEAAALYEKEVRQVVPAGADGLPEFDLVLLGLGTNGHMASLFPYQPALHEKTKIVIAEYIDEVKMTRLTFSAPLINAAKQVVFVSLGKDKATVVKDVITGVFDPERLPAQLVRPSHGKLTWILDAGSAEKLPEAVLTHK
jgi:6-phosphogluconolactonase